GDELIVAGRRGFVGVFSVADGAAGPSLTVPGRLGVAVTRNGTSIAIGCQDRSVRVWDAKQDSVPMCLQGHDGAVNAVAFSPDGLTLAAGTSAGSVTLWHVPSWQETGRFETPMDVINDLAFSVDGSRLAIAGGMNSDEGRIVLWDTKSADD